jgi:hypothetical protein
MKGIEGFHGFFEIKDALDCSTENNVAWETLPIDILNYKRRISYYDYAFISLSFSISIPLTCNIPSILHFLLFNNML